jgi:hypothetical protein
MTLAIAWTRHVGTVVELVLASDSRLRGGFVWDCAPKVFPLLRSDCAIVFAGHTAIAYPIILQLNNALRLHDRSMNRGLPLGDYRGHVLRVINDMRRSMHDFAIPDTATGEEETYLILGGYSWRESQFVIWTLHFDRNIDVFTFRPATPWRGTDGEKVLAIAGNAVDEAKARLVNLLRARGKLEHGAFDMEPFEVLRDMIRGQVDPAIGGAPQLVKVYRYLNYAPFGVYWPSRSSGRRTLFGRALLDYEDCPFGLVDPDEPSQFGIANSDGA